MSVCVCVCVVMRGKRLSNDVWQQDFGEVISNDHHRSVTVAHLALVPRLSSRDNSKNGPRHARAHGHTVTVRKGGQSVGGYF